MSVITVLTHKKHRVRPDRKKTMESIVNLLQHSDLEVRNLIDRIEEERTFVIECVRYLLEEGSIY